MGSENLAQTERQARAGRKCTTGNPTDKRIGTLIGVAGAGYAFVITRSNQCGRAEWSDQMIERRRDNLVALLSGDALASMPLIPTGVGRGRWVM